MARRAILAAALAAALVPSCSAPPIAGDAAPPEEKAASRSAPIAWAVLINGGGSKEQNYLSHVLHLREMLDVLRAAGIPDRRIDVFTGDGTDPAPDLAVRDTQDEADFWLIQGLPIGRRLGHEVRYEDTRLEGVRVHKADKESLLQWTQRSGRRLQPGDTLLVYVTDHGKKNNTDLRNNSIVLWGQSWSVAEYKRFIARIPKGVRVVSVMSQCFSGSFAEAMYTLQAPPRIRGNVCGYFSSTPERQAYGCYPENLGKDNVGHSFRLFEALRAHGDFLAAHHDVMLSDRTPDLPNRTSDLLLQRILEDAAEQHGLSYRHFVDDLLENAGTDDTRFVELHSMIEAIGVTFGAPPPRRLSEAAEQSRELPRLARELRAHARRWSAALTDLRRANYERFLEANAFWRDYLTEEFANTLDDEQRRELTSWLLTDLKAFTTADSDTDRRLRTLRTIANESADAAYRMEVRKAAALRMQQLLVRIAGLYYLDTAGEELQRRDFDALSACEAVRIPAAAGGAAPEPRPPFPALGDERTLLDTVRPGWLGIEFAPADVIARADYGLEAGAIRITRVFAGSPAERAGLIEGDLVLGPPDAPFRERNQIREWVMTSMQGQQRPLRVVRGGLPFTLWIEIGAPPL